MLKTPSASTLWKAVFIVGGGGLLFILVVTHV